MPTSFASASTDDQSLGLQRDALRSAGCDKLCGHRTGRAEAPRPGDMLMARRRGRSLRGLVLLGRTPNEADIGLMGVREINTGFSGSRLVFYLRT